MKRVMQIALAILGLSTGCANADGMSLAATPVTKSVTCYAKVIGSGAFLTDAMTVGAVNIDSMGQQALGIGGQVGCDVMRGRWLAGLFVDGVWNRANINITTPIGTAMHMPIGSEYSVGARVGVFPTAATLLYGLVAYSQANESATMFAVPLAIGSPRGVALGGGIETTLASNLVLSLEYRHTGFDTQTSTAIPSKFDLTENNVRLGLGVRF